MYYMGFTYTEAYTLPIYQRMWFIQRINNEIKRSNETGTGASRAAHMNGPAARQMHGRSRSNAPAKLRRFT